MTSLAHMPEVAALIARGALFAINHSAGKDSQAMSIRLAQIIPANQLLVVHADLGEVEWAGNLQHIEATVGGAPVIVAKARRGLLQMVQERGMWPSPQQRQCTSDLKRGPIERELRRYLRAHPEFGGLVVNCMGLRAEESPKRAKQSTFRLNKGNSVAGREWYDWLPIHAMPLREVWATIAGAGQEAHPAYALGMSRLSCVFCIMASVPDLVIAARANPQLYRRYVGIEKQINHTLSMTGRSLEAVTGIAASIS
jgi:3'-phosphoadenosine 5'-phosphosulfate sulfotransferase (PAPS reductase)/FAD synthetase